MSLEANEINGDLSLDGKITQDDVSLLQGYIDGTVTLTETQKGQADVNKDGLINSNDLNALENILNSEVILKEDSTSASYGVTAGKDYTLYLTVTNIISKSDYTYEVKYAPDVLQLAEIGLGGKTKFNSYLNIKYSEDIQILSNSNGTLRFKVNSIGKNWSGILSSVTFKALKTGQTSISFGGKAGYIK